MKRFIAFIVLMILGTAVFAAPKNTVSTNPKYYRPQSKILDSLVRVRIPGIQINDPVKVVKVVKEKNKYDFYFNQNAGTFPFVEGDAAWFIKTWKRLVGSKVPVGNIYLGSDNITTLDTSPLGNNGSPSGNRNRLAVGRSPMLILDHDKKFITKGLNGRHIALWGSHGYYHNNLNDTWGWQRPPLFGIVEDLLSQSIAIDYLAPMLENAGANIYMPRERGVQNNEVIIEGTLGLREIEFSIPEEGIYPVFITYSKQTKITAVEVEVADKKLTVNPTMAYDMPVWLGEFYFPEGDNTIKVSQEGIIRRVKVGNGYGRSGMPRFCEGSKYYLEDNGADASLVSPTRFYVGNSPSDTLAKKEYTDDYMSRGLWTQNLSYGSRINPKRVLERSDRDRHLRDGGKNVPVDVALALHTDGMVPLADSTYVGTLVIYTLKHYNKDKFPNKEDRILNRELCNLVQSQIVEDLRETFDDAFVRRGLWNRSYSESRTTGTSTVLLEGFSHLSFPDMVLGNNPYGRLVYCRAIYKGVLKYISNHYGCPYIVTPMGVKDFKAELGEVKDENVEVKLSWNAVQDRLEPTARPKGYIVYERKGKAFREIARVKNNSYTHSIPLGEIRSYCIAAYNEGGKSFDSEILAAGMPLRHDASGEVCDLSDSVVLVVNNFTRIAPASYFAEEETAGFNYDEDAGVPYKRDLAFVGKQYNFDRKSKYTNDEFPGHGASFYGKAGNVVAGNDFDYVFRHAKAAFEAGYPVESISASAYMEGEKNEPWVTDIICGKQIKTGMNLNDKDRYFFETLPEGLRNKIDESKNVIISGSYIASDAYREIYPIQIDSVAKVASINYLNNALGIKNYTPTGSDSMKVTPLQNNGLRVAPFSLYKEQCPEHYSLEKTDAFIPAKGAVKLLIYEDSMLPAAVLYKNKVTFAFPLECITSDEAFESVVKETLKIFK